MAQKEKEMNPVPETTSIIPQIIFFFSLFIAFIIGIFFSKKANKEEATVLDLTNKIKQKQQADAKAKAAADQAVQEYQDALKKYDPAFHNDDDNGGKPSA
jgi:hypothetical protein